MEQPHHEALGQDSDAASAEQGQGGTLSSAQLNLIWRNREEARRRKAQKAAASSGQAQNLDKPPEMPEHHDELMCIICRSPLRNGAEAYALECAHVFHELCIMGYASSKGKDVRDCCPFHCRKSFAMQSIVIQDGGADADHVAESPAEVPEAEAQGLSISEEAAAGLEATGFDAI